MAEGVHETAAALQARQRELEAQLAAMTPAEREGPAWIQVRHDPDTALATADTPGAVLPQQENPAFLDPALRSTTPQCMAVIITDGMLASTWKGDDRESRWVMAQRVRDALDWDGLAGLLSR